MTTIAWDGKTLAADRRCSYHNMPAAKLRRLKDGSLVGIAGDAGCGLQGIDWLESGGEKPTLTGDRVVEYLRIFPSGKVVKIHNFSGDQPVDMPFFAVGSGCDYAMGAMAMGATAEQAIEIATRFDSNTGGGIDTLTLEVTP